MNKTIQQLFQEKQSFEKKFATDILQQWDVLEKKIPKELERFKQKTFKDPVKWFLDLYKNTSNNSNNFHKIWKDEDYGFRDLDELYKGLVDLKTAWENDITIDLQHEIDFIKIRYSPSS